MPEKRDGLRAPVVVATTLPFFARAAAIVDETWHELDRMAGTLDQYAGGGGRGRRGARGPRTDHERDP